MLNEPYTLTFASSNADKLRELTHLIDTLRLPIRLVPPRGMEAAEETGLTFAENALIKAQAACPAEGSDFVLGEDSGFVIPSLDGTYGLSPFPGVRSARWMTPTIRAELLQQESPAAITAQDKNLGILKLMEGQSNRQAQYVCAMVLVSTRDNTLTESLGEMPLEIIREGAPRGTHGFGYDPIVLPVFEDGQTGLQTVAELPPSEKNRLSHRGKAFISLAKALRLLQ